MTAPPVFIDRDGTLIVENHYLRDPAQVRLEKDAVPGLLMMRRLGHALIVVSNQSGIGRGMLTLADAQRVNARVEELLRDSGIDILGWYMCPHAPEAMCDCRKPSPGMALAASHEWGLELAGSYVIGDKRSDLELADAIGATGILVTTGQGPDSAAWAASSSRPIVTSLLAAAHFIAARDGCADDAVENPALPDAYR